MKPLKNLLAAISQRWARREKNKRLSSMPTLLIALCGAISFGNASAAGAVVAKVWPSYWQTATSTPLEAWGWQGAYVTFALAFMLLAFWYFGSLAKRCNSILQKRLFP